MQLSKIINGWTNYFTDNSEVEAMAKERIKECITCPEKKESKVFSWVKDDIKEISSTVCNKCNCPLAMKVRSINENCPLNKW